MNYECVWYATRKECMILARKHLFRLGAHKADTKVKERRILTETLF